MMPKTRLFGTTEFCVPDRASTIDLHVTELTGVRLYKREMRKFEKIDCIIIIHAIVADSLPHGDGQIEGNIPVIVLV